MKKIFYPTALNVGFAFIASLLGLYSTAKTSECFTSCGWPIRFVTQIPVDEKSVRFAIHWLGLIVVWLLWYAIGSLLIAGVHKLIQALKN